MGPFLSIGMSWDDGEWVVADGTPGAFWIRGRLIDGAGERVPDGVVETWQADPEGRFDHPDDPRGAVARQGFRGLRPVGDADRRIVRDPHGQARPRPRWRGRLAGAPPRHQRAGPRAARPGRYPCYFADEAAANAADPVLGSLPDDPSRATLVAEVAPDGYRLDIVLQGERETTFFAV